MKPWTVRAQEQFEAAIDTVDKNLAEHRDGLDGVTTRMVDAAKKVEKKVEENHIGATRHHLRLKVIHEKDADDTIDEILRLGRKRVLLRAAVRGRKLLKTSDVAGF